MNRLVYKYSFAKRVPMDDVEDSLFIAALAVEALQGRAAVRLDAYYRVDSDARTCVIDAETPVGCDIARILSTLIARGYGESAFRFERTEEHTGINRLLCAIGVVL